MAAPLEIAEILSELSTDVSISLDGMEVIADASTADTSAIDISSEFELFWTAGNMSEFFADNAALEGEVSSVVDGLVDNIEAQGVQGAEVGVQAGSDVSMANAEVQAGEDAAAGRPGLWARIKRYGGIALKVGGALALIDIIGRWIYTYLSKSDKKKDSLSEETKEQLKKVRDSLETLGPVFQSWQKGLEALEANTMMSYGTMTVKQGDKTVTVEVMDVVAYLIQDATNQITLANDILKDLTDDKVTVYDVNQLTDYIFATFSDAQAVLNLRKNKGNIVKDDKLAMFKFPPLDDEQEVQKVLQKDFPQWKDAVRTQGMNLAKMGARMATNAFIKSQSIMEMNSYLRKKIYPEIKDAAEKAGKKAGKKYIEDHKAKLVELDLIPIVGTEKAKEYAKKLKKEAIKVAQTEAGNAGRKKAKELQKSMQETLKPIVQKVMAENKQNIKEIAEMAARKSLSQVKT